MVEILKRLTPLVSDREAVVEQALAREAERAAASPSVLARALPAYEEPIEPAAAPGARVNRRV